MFQRIRNHTAQLVRLATPIVLARSGIMLMTTVDIVMVGHYSATELAYQSIGLAVIMPMVVVGMGLLNGTLVIAANSFGENQFEMCGTAWRRSLLYAMILGIVAGSIAMLGEPILLFFGQTEALSRHGSEVMRITGYGLPAFMLFLTTAFFLEAITRPKPWLFVIAAGNVVNLALNAAFIFGNLGFDAMGAVGAAWATTAARWCVAIALIAYVLLMRDHRTFAVRASVMRYWRKWADWRSWADQRRIGYATGIGVGADSFAFSMLGIFAGWLGEIPLAAFAATFNLLTMVFMVTLGVGSATAVRVGIAYGQRRPGSLALAGWTGLALNSLFMAGAGVAFYLVPEAISDLFTDNADMISIMASLIALSSVVLIVDGGQSVMGNALRGRRDVWFPCAVQVTCYFAMMVPAAYYFAFDLSQGALGLVQGMLLASCVSWVLLVWRFHRLNPVQRVGNVVAQTDPT